MLFITQKQHLSEIRLKTHCVKGQVRSNEEKMELFFGNWLILSHSFSMAGGESHWHMKRLHLRLGCVSPGCWLEVGGKAISPTWHSRGWEWDARKEEMANDSKAARRLVSLTGKEWQQCQSGEFTSPKIQQLIKVHLRLRVSCFIGKHFLSDWNSCTVRIL